MSLLSSARSRRCFIFVSVLLCSALMIVVDGILMPPYAVKSAIKVVLFLGAMAAYVLFSRDETWKTLFRPTKRSLLLAFALGAGVYGIILGGYFATSSFVDYSGITASLTGNTGVNGDNFLFVSLYISFVNSFLEELFFRGLSFSVLRRVSPRPVAYLFSSVCFAVYHAGITTGWFDPLMYVLTLAGLFAAGLVFDRLDEKAENLFVSWIVHMFANFAINTVGFILFGKLG